MRKALCAMTLMQQSSPRPRRLRAALIGLGLDNVDDQNRLTRGDQSLIFGGSAETHAELRETALRMEHELDRQGLDLGDLDPAQLAELAAMIDSPELREIALRLQAGLERDGRAFEELTAEELTALSAPSGCEPGDKTRPRGSAARSPSHRRARPAGAYPFHRASSVPGSPREGTNPLSGRRSLSGGGAARPAGVVH